MSISDANGNVIHSGEKLKTGTVHNSDGTTTVTKKDGNGGYIKTVTDEDGNVVSTTTITPNKGAKSGQETYSYTTKDADGNTLKTGSYSHNDGDLNGLGWTINAVNIAGSGFDAYNKVSTGVDQAKNMTIFGGGGEVTYSEEAESLATGKEIDMNGANGKKKKYSQAEIDALLNKYGTGDYYTTLINGRNRRSSFK